jgi:hypothetical protein
MIKALCEHINNNMQIFAPRDDETHINQKTRAQQVAKTPTKTRELIICKVEKIFHPEACAIFHFLAKTKRTHRPKVSGAQKEKGSCTYIAGVCVRHRRRGK